MERMDLEMFYLSLGFIFICCLALFEKHQHYLLLIDLKQLAESLMHVIRECFKDILLTMT